MQTFLKVVSAILNPILLPFFGVLLLFHVGAFRELPMVYRLYIEGLVFLNMCVIPGFGVWLLKKSGHISDLDVSVRSERIFPYLITVICYSSACFLLYRYQMPWWILKLFLGSTIAIIAAFFITLRWKISAHTMAFGCLITSAFLVCLGQSMYPIKILSALLLLAGIQASSRIYLEAHTLGQVCGGFTLGVCSVLCTFYLLP
jgi:hypothetical protein